MFSPSPSPTRDGSTTSSRSSTPAGTIRVRIIVYVRDRADPKEKAMDLPLYQTYCLRDSVWFQETIRGDYRREMHIWQRKYEDWVTVTRNQVKIWVSDKSTTFILRLPHVRQCVGFGHQIQLREDRRRAYYGLQPALSREVRDIRVPRPEKIGDDFIVVVYPAMLAVPLVFIIRLELDGRIAIWDYPALAQACFDCESPEDADTGIRVWNPQHAIFDFLEADEAEALYAVDGYDFLLVRHEYNRYAPGLGKYIAQLEMQTIRRVQPSNIPFDDPTHTRIARPAQSVRAKREPSPDVSMATEESDSEESDCTDDDEDGIMTHDRPSPPSPSVYTKTEVSDSGPSDSTDEDEGPILEDDNRDWQAEWVE
ncbi:hypothetical protein LXA43DRAFT_1104420 [Ganoderma leucocontextum]|nr:hypothetical protein LXA43DRAFT_1104420 [Ganoderma leucocontextum]